MRLNVTDIKVRIIRRLVLWRKWGGSHTENIINGLPSHLRGDKTARKALKELIKSKWIVASTKTQETHYSLNPKKAAEILDFYERYCKN
jgi:hypothetical protein